MARIWPESSLQNGSNRMAHLVVYFMNLPSLRLLVLYTYEKLYIYDQLHCVINVLYVAFWAFVRNCEKSGVNLIKIP